MRHKNKVSVPETPKNICCNPTIRKLIYLFVSFLILKG